MSFSLRGYLNEGRVTRNDFYMNKSVLLVSLFVASLIGLPFYFVGVLFWGVIAYFLLLLYFIIYFLYCMAIRFAAKRSVPILYLVPAPFVLSVVVHGVILPFSVSGIFSDLSFLLAYLSFLTTYSLALVLIYFYCRKSSSGNPA